MQNYFRGAAQLALAQHHETLVPRLFALIRWKDQWKVVAVLQHSIVPAKGMGTNALSCAISLRNSNVLCVPANAECVPRISQVLLTEGLRRVLALLF